MASTFAAVLRLGPIGPSIRRIVGSESFAASANFGWLQSRRPRAALIWAADSGSLLFSAFMIVLR